MPRVIFQDAPSQTPLIYDRNRREIYSQLRQYLHSYCFNAKFGIVSARKKPLVSYFALDCGFISKALGLSRAKGNCH
jgi:hypothetical protein